MDFHFIKKEEPVEYFLGATQQGQIIHQQNSDEISNRLGKLDVHVQNEPEYIWNNNEVDLNASQLSADSDEMQYEVPGEAPKTKPIMPNRHHPEFINALGDSIAKKPPKNSSKPKKRKSKLKVQSLARSWNYKCVKCDATFIYKTPFINHAARHRPSWVERATLLSHLKMLREGTKKFHCKLCRSSFLRMSVFNRHFCTPYTRSNTSCNRVFTNRSSLATHRCKKTNPTNATKQLANLNGHRCDKCNKIFYDIHHFVLHVAQNCSKKIKYQCDYCLKPKFLDKGSLIRHFSFQHKIDELKRISCQKCRYTFASSSMLKKHRNTMFH